MMKLKDIFSIIATITTIIMAIYTIRKNYYIDITSQRYTKLIFPLFYALQPYFYITKEELQDDLLRREILRIFNTILLPDRDLCTIRLKQKYFNLMVSKPTLTQCLFSTTKQGKISLVKQNFRSFCRQLFKEYIKGCKRTKIGYLSYDYILFYVNGHYIVARVILIALFVFVCFGTILDIYLIHNSIIMIFELVELFKLP